jgi:hypothetical protein
MPILRIIVAGSILEDRVNPRLEDVPASRSPGLRLARPELRAVFRDINAGHAKAE